MKHFCSLKNRQILYFERMCLSFSMAVARVRYWGIHGSLINSAQHILERVRCTPTIYFPYCYVKYIPGNLSPELPPYIRPANAETISTLISHPFKEKAKIKIIRNKIKSNQNQNIRRSSLWSSLQVFIFMLNTFTTHTTFTISNLTYHGIL